MLAGDSELSIEEPLRAAFEENYLSLLRLCTLLTGRAEAAEDVVQESFVRVAARIASVPQGLVGTYLRKTAVNVWRNRLRRLAVERRYRPFGTDPPFAQAQIDEREAMWKRVMQLPERQRACLVLRYYEDLSEREVAETLGVSPGTVKSQTSRALDKLRKGFRDET